MNVINTKRLILREWEDKDLEPFARLNQDQKILEFLPSALTFEESTGWINRIKEHFKEYGFGLWAATLITGDHGLHRAGTRFIGYIGLNIPAFEAHFTPCVEIGWRLASEYWGYGYATEGAQAVLKYAFDELRLREVVSFTVPANTRSIRVMEKLGMKRDTSGDFRHPKLPLDHPLSWHVLYRVKHEKS
ncbi:MAG: GNAT family N-acetyltransferase [Gammaproteobacteria bacterium]|nr:GNAT family N-acetyltransferase [Gammaproteobacteria bacterium]MCW5584157.1 GNAT family N-acetyltransferase [Gammaproteobacteria bacterium]